MDFKNRHPLNAIDGYESLSMLEALIPFVEYQLKLPLALFIKFNEVRLIIKCFQSPNNLTRLGLHYANSDPWDMICSLTGMPPELVKMMMSMMDGGENSMFSDIFNTFSNNKASYASNECHSNCGDGNTNTFGSGFSTDNISNIMNMMQTMQADFSNTVATPSTTDMSQDCTSQSSDNFEDNIQRLLAEYDLQQAGSLSAEDDLNYSNYE